MQFDEASRIIATSPLLKMLRAHTAPLMLSFFQQEFLQDKRKSVPQQELVRHLAEYLEFLDGEEGTYEEETDSKIDTLILARKYLDKWTDQLRLLILNRDNDGENHYDLTIEAERAVQFVETLQTRKSHVGTESRFKDIFHKLRELVENSSSDPNQKLNDLEKQKNQLEEEIRIIKDSGKVPSVYNDTQIKERFEDINRMARELVTDFREVERNFKDIGHEIYEKQQQQLFSKGEILGIALDSWEELKEKDQGRSFYAFWQFLQSESSQQELQQLVAKVYELVKQKGISQGEDHFLKRIKRYLHQYGQKVVESNQRMADRLNRVLAEKSLAERRRAQELTQEIRMLCLSCIDYPPKEKGFIEIEIFKAEVHLIAHRTLHEPHQGREIKHAVSADEQLPDNLDLGRLFDQFYVDKTVLQKNIQHFLNVQTSVSLGEILAVFPPEKGLTEVLTYMSLATQSPRHQISNEEGELIYLNKDKSRVIELPKITFSK